MIPYEVYLLGVKDVFHSFSHLWQYQKGERLFVERDGKVYSLTIATITHDHTKDVPTVRLNCLMKKYEPDA